ncbi:FKBP-type peptidyl-prolyl cis-trans isomerase [Mycolicibacterium hodleri]|uniref:FKBP-type peptidyl-prolyl cis-trans isomerase n=1 Tax=Mycolicibacterium hodleri TaxID=49897 RepID=UPI003557CB1B
MNSTRASRSVAFVACAAPLVMMLAACGSDADAEPGSSSTAASSTSSAVAAPGQSPAAESCPSAAPAAGGTPEWTLPGATGNVAVTGSTDSAAPEVTVSSPFSVTATQVHTLAAGSGPVVPDTATVSVCYMGVNGRDGSTFDSSYQRGEPAEFPLDGVVPGFQKAIVGQTVGSTVAVAMAPADGYPEGQPAAGIQKGDSLVFAIKILGITG